MFVTIEQEEESVGSEEEEKSTGVSFSGTQFSCECQPMYGLEKQHHPRFLYEPSLLLLSKVCLRSAAARLMAGSSGRY